MLTPEQVQQYRAKYNITPAPSANEPTRGQSLLSATAPVQPQAQEPGYLSRIGSQYEDVAKEISSGVDRTLAPGISGMERVKQAGQTALRAAGGIAGAAFAPVTEALAPAVTPVIQKLASLPGVSGGVQAVSDWASKHPDAAKNLESVFNLVTLGGGSQLEQPIKNVVGKELKSVGKGVVQTGKNIVEDVSSLGKKVQKAIDRKNVPENFDASLDRLVSSVKEVDGVKTRRDPLKTYDEFYEQEQKFKGDIKEDTAIGKVGERMGDAYDQVVKQRRDVGKAMETEMKRVGKIKTDISESLPKLDAELQRSGLKFNYKTMKLSGSDLSKVTSQDKAILQQYIRNVNRLSNTPTAAQLDAFLSRVPSELDVYKSKNNITGTTNGERIIKSHLRDLRESLTENANPDFKAYSDARNSYSDLSGFLEEGSKFLGQKTQSGDYARDASLAKSSVQSILNQGKKDWMLRLEDLTGYQAMDESMLALQAMKDSGNFRGQSLLDLLAPKEGGSIPTSKSGIVDKVVQKGLEFGAQKVSGTPSEQTRRVIMDRIKKGNESTPSQFNVNDVPGSTVPKAGLAIKDVSKVDPEDVGTMRDFTDYVAGEYKPDADMAHKLELAASRLAENYGIKEFKTLKGLAHAFGKLLDSLPN